MGKAEKVRLIAHIVGWGFAAALLYHSIGSIFFHWRYPWNTFLFDPNDLHRDLLNAVPAFQNYGFSTIIFPVVNILYWILFHLKATTAYNVLFGLFFLFLGITGILTLWISSFSWPKNLFYIFVIIGLGYPVLFDFNRGNIECLVFVFVLLFTFLFKAKRYILASLFLSLAIGMKLFPAVFIISYIKRKKFKEAGWLLLFLALLASTLAIAPNFHRTLARAHWFFHMYKRDYIIGDAGLGYGHSLFGLFKVALYHFPKSIFGTDAHTWLRLNENWVLNIYTIGTLLLYSSIAFFIYINKNLSYWREVAILVTIFCLFPNISADYKLLHLYTPLLLLINSNESYIESKKYVWMFGLLLIPKAYYFFNGLPNVGISTVLEPLLLTVFLFMLMSGSYFNTQISTKADLE